MIKTPAETFVIVKNLNAHNSEFFTDNVSFDKAALISKCNEMNTEYDNWMNTELEKSHDKFYKNKNNKPAFIKHAPFNNFEVLTLTEAISKFESAVADYNTEHDESY